MASKTSTLLSEGDFVSVLTDGEWEDFAFIAADAWGVWVSDTGSQNETKTMLPWAAVDRIEVAR